MTRGQPCPGPYTAEVPPIPPGIAAPATDRLPSRYSRRSCSSRQASTYAWATVVPIIPSPEPLISRIGVQQNEQPVAELPHSRDVFTFNQSQAGWRLNRVCGDAENFRNGVHDKAEYRALDFDYYDPVLFVGMSFFQTKPFSESDHGNDFPAQIHHSLHKLARVWI